MAKVARATGSAQALLVDELNKGGAALYQIGAVTAITRLELGSDGLELCIVATEGQDLPDAAETIRALARQNGVKRVRWVITAEARPKVASLPKFSTAAMLARAGFNVVPRSIEYVVEV